MRRAVGVDPLPRRRSAIRIEQRGGASQDDGGGEGIVLREDVRNGPGQGVEFEVDVRRAASHGRNSTRSAFQVAASRAFRVRSSGRRQRNDSHDPEFLDVEKTSAAPGVPKNLTRR
jgi:hypothetical protein